MIVKCLEQTGEGLPSDYRALGYSSQTEFDLDLHEVYRVGGICIWKGLPHALLDPTRTGHASWYPLWILQIVDARVPTDWHVCYYKGLDEPGISMVIGYPELSDPSHFRQLMERDTGAMDLFRRRFREMSEVQEEPD